MWNLDNKTKETDTKCERHWERERERYINRMSLTKSDSLCESDEQKSVLQKTSLESEVRLVNTTFVLSVVRGPAPV